MPDLFSGPRTFIIAEACSNIIPHLDKLPAVVDEVASTGATSLKVQLFLASHFPEGEQASKKLSVFPRDCFPELVSLCHDKGLLAGASVFDPEAVDLCVQSGADFLKLASREWENDRLIKECFTTKMPVIRSFPWSGSFSNQYDKYQRNDSRLMACVPEYPAHSFHLPRSFGDRAAGWSSHTNHYTDCLAAISRGATIIEKHIKFSPNDYEAGWSLDVTQFSKMVQDIRWLEERL